MSDYFRPRGDITTVLDLTDRDAQDNTYFPIDTAESWFHRENTRTVFPTTASVQEFTQRGPADWGQRCTFEIGSLPAGDLLQGIMLQIQLGSWYNESVVNQLYTAALTTDLQNYSDQYWTYSNSLGTSIIEYADFIVNEQTIERITGEFISTYLKLNISVNEQHGVSMDAIGAVPYSYLSSTGISPPVIQTPFHPRRPFPTEDGTYFCLLPFFFLRTKLSEVFPLLSCNEGNVRIDIKLRSFEDLVRKYTGYRVNAMETPLNQTVYLTTTTTPTTSVPVTTLEKPPAFRDFRVITSCSLLTGILRNKFLHQPFEQMVKLMQPFHFEEPLKYIVSKPNPNSDTVEIQLPLEMNHPVVELVWVFRRKAVAVNNEWSNFSPAIGFQSNPSKVFPPWLDYATIRMNGQEVIAADGNWFREEMASKHTGGITSYDSYIYGYSFSAYPTEHQPSGTANASRATSITLNMRVNTPIVTDLTKLTVPSYFDSVDVGGWEVFVYSMYYNWLRFENGLCNRMFSS